MIRALRRRFIWGAMAAFGILMLLLVGALALVGTLRMESQLRSFLEYALGAEVESDGEPAERGELGGPDFALRGQPGGGHYLITASADGEILSVEERGIWEADEDAARAMGEEILASGDESGRLGSYRYLVERTQDGGARIALADGALQAGMLRSLLGSASVAALCCMLALFFILLPVSERVTRSYAANIERQKQFVTNAGHEVKTPVAIIMSNVDALELIQGESKWSRNIRGQTERMSALLQRLLFMARLDEHSLTPPSEKVQLDALVRAEIEPYRPAIEERGLRFSCQIPEDVAMRGSREYLQQMVHMLLDNAVYYADAGGEISLSLERRRQRVRLVLENSVEKLPDCAPEALFDRFFRGDSARTQSGGSYGIGLSAARAIAEMHRGRICAEYPQERRIRFTVELPLRA